MHWHILIDGRLVFGKNNNLIVYKTGNVVDDAHVHDVIKPYVFYRALMLMYGKEASNRKQEIDRQHYTIPNQRPKDKHCGKI